MTIDSRFAASFVEDALYIRVAARRRVPVAVFTGLWLAGWSLIVAVLALEIVRHPDMDLERNAIGLGFWMLAGGAVGFVLLWMATGQTEIVRVDGGSIAIERRAGPLKRRQHLDVGSIRSVTYRAVRPRGLREFAPVARFWRGEIGRVVIGSAGRSYAFGERLGDAEAAEIVRLIESRIPHRRSGAVPDGNGGRSRPLGWVASAAGALVAMALVWPVVTVPLKLAVIDRAICFFDDSIPPARPIDVAGLRPTRRVTFVPLENVSPETVAQVADHFRIRMNVPVEVGSGLTVDAYDPRRRQINAAAVLQSLQQRFPGQRDVIVAITHEDMYIPGFGWRYAFSYRTAGRLAVVSTARMDRGCLGLFTASAERRMSRLRKMVGKNIGVLYFGLPLSDDPRSLLYANIGGPQELDRMSEMF